MTLSKRGCWTPYSFVLALWAVIVTLILAVPSGAAPYAALVMDARSGKVLHAHNADTRLHPASLTKMMTLYVAFEALRLGEIDLDTKVKISHHAANEVPSKLGLKAGQEIELRYLIRAAAVKSANDAATAIGEAIEGSEAAFARRMNRTAKALGMSRSTFKNAHGLTESGHLSTARDMSVLGRHLFYDYPQYYNLFSRTQTNAKLAQVRNTNRRFLAAYRGADGIKTGYTQAAGYNLTASAERNGERIIATVFGATSTPARNAKVAELLDLGFKKAPSRVAVNKPSLPRYAHQTQRVEMTLAVIKSQRPIARPEVGSEPDAPDLPDSALIAMQDSIAQAVAESLAQATPEPDPAPATAPVTASTPEAVEVGSDSGTAVAAATSAVPEQEPVAIAAADPRPAAPVSSPRPRILYTLNRTLPTKAAAAEPIVVTRVSTSGGRHWGINVGRYPSRFAAERMLLKTALAEMSVLDGALRKVGKNRLGFEANFVGMTQDQAATACQRLAARAIECNTLGPS